MMEERYGEDLAYIHDAGFGGFALGAAPGILAVLRENGIGDGLVVEMGCGSEIFVRKLIEAGYRVLGIDISEAMIDLAQERAPEAEFRVAPLFEAEIPPCAAVTSIGECLNYLLDPTNDERTLARLFRRVYDALDPGGVFIFDFLEPGQLAPNTPTKSCTEGEDWVVLVEKEEDPERETLTRRITTFRKTGEHYCRTNETHRLRLYKAPDVAAEPRLKAELSGEGRLQIDPARIEQAVLILIDNAAKYGPSGGLVTLASEVKGDSLCISVEDRGPGISDKDLPNIFERFYRADKSRCRKEGGAGLGLSIASTIAELHGGSIEATSFVGKGTKITLCISMLSAARRTKSSSLQKEIS